VDVHKLLQELTREEGLKLKPYRDSVGKLTIGVGRNLDDVGISREEALELCAHDIVRTIAELDEHLPWWRELDEVRQRVIADMGFNLGVDGDPHNPNDALTGFRNTLAMAHAGNYAGAAANMLKSKWATQVGARAQRLARMMATGRDE
jgi:lysozyme